MYYLTKGSIFSDSVFSLQTDIKINMVQLVTGLLLLPLALAASVDRRQASPSLNTLIQNAGKKFWGQCADQGRLTENSQNPAIYKADFGQVTPENSMKWDATERMWLFNPFCIF
jgi:endo-1,4-beta-xylanase